MVETTRAPILIAALLGIISSISPCPLATNISAIGFISKDIQDRRRVIVNGVSYLIGHTLSYTLLGIVLVFLLEQGAAVFRFQRAISIYGELLIGPFMIIVGLLMLGVLRINLPFSGDIGSKMEKRGQKRNWQASFLLGVVFALAFCPTNGAIFFGGLVPLALSSSQGYLLPLIFALATSIPVIIFAWIITFSISKLAAYYKKVKTFELWARRFAATIFIGVGLYFFIEVLF